MYAAASIAIAIPSHRVTPADSNAAAPAETMTRIALQSNPVRHLRSDATSIHPLQLATANGVALVPAGAGAQMECVPTCRRGQVQRLILRPSHRLQPNEATHQPANAGV